MSDPETFLMVAEIAELLKLPPDRVRNWIDRGKLSAVRVGSRRVRVKQSDLDRFIEAGATAVPVGDPERSTPILFATNFAAHPQG